MSNAPSRIYTFKDLKPIKGWPYSRQHTTRLINAGRFPKPIKAPGGNLNFWTDEQIETYYAQLSGDSTIERRSP
jgi:predicted DNA-binding transcriptional regulator AlpA